MPLSLNYLEVFHAVARSGSVTRAGDLLAVSQPAVSKQLKQLERSLGIRLIERAGRGIRLTEQGQALAEYTGQIFAIIEQAEAALEEFAGMSRGRLAMGAGTTIGTYLLP